MFFHLYIGFILKKRLTKRIFFAILYSSTFLGGSMEGFRKIDSGELENSIKMIGDDWMLITAYDKEQERANAMTASWGAMGVLLNKSVYIFNVSMYCNRFKKLLNDSTPIFKQNIRFDFYILVKHHINCSN